MNSIVLILNDSGFKYSFLNPCFNSWRLEEEIARFNIFQRSVLGTKERLETNKEMDIRNYAKYILKEGTTDEKRELLGNLRTRITYKDKSITLGI